jgi:sec-independent protein translocase protein TatA
LANRHDFVIIRASDGIASGDSPRNSAQYLLKRSCFSFRGRHMGSMSLMHWLIVLAIVLVLFGAGKLPRVMGDFAKGIKAFKAGMKEEDEAAASSPPAQVTPPAGAAASTASVGVGDRPRDHA